MDQILKTLPGQMSLNFHPSMKPRILLVLYCINSLESWWWCNSVGDIFFLLAHFQPCLIFFTDHAHPFMITVYPFSSDYFQKDKTQCHEAQIISNCFLEHKNVFTVFKWPKLPDLNLIERLWNVVKLEIHIDIAAVTA